MDKTDILKAQSPAALAEEFIVKSIWNNRFPVGSDLPAERELADMIGITRTTLREVLQRLARDGWLNIQHGKATKVNNIWETAGPNIIETLIQLDRSMMPMIITNVVSLRTKMGEIYIPEAVHRRPQECVALFNSLAQLQDTALAYATFDYSLYRGFTFIADKPVYGLILNSFKELYLKVAALVFNNAEFRQETFVFYCQLRAACLAGNVAQVSEYLQAHRLRSSEIWTEVLRHLPTTLSE